MIRTALALVSVLAVAPAFEVNADLPRLGIFRKKKDDTATPEKDKAARAKQLIESLKNDSDEKKRMAAVDELADYDTRTHVDVLPAIVASLKSDPSSSVRAAAASAIGATKPAVQTAGVALEQTLANDPSEAVRQASQQALWQYHLNGYRSAGVNPSSPQTAEPPLAKPKPLVASTPSKPVTAMTVSQTKPAPLPGGVYQQTAEPPLAKPRTEIQPPTPDLVVPPLPVVPTVPSAGAIPSIPPPGR